MASYRLYQHKDFEQTARDLPPIVRQKALWAQVMLGTRGRTPRVKGTTGLNARWRRTPVQGNHYYMWWIPASESLWATNMAASGSYDTRESQSILIHSIRHHDDTDTPLDLGSILDYEEIPVQDLEPRFEEQLTISRRVRNERVALATIKGLPGSGKTISLFYLVKDLARRVGDGDILYVTYTSRLKRAAQEFIHAQGPEIQARVRICTLSEIEEQITDLSTHLDPYGELPRFIRFLNAQKSSSLGVWRKYTQTLYTEVRGQIFGRQFPPDYVPGGDVGTLSQRLRDLHLRDAQAYAESRDIDLATAQMAHQLAQSAERNGFFRDQVAARHTLAFLRNGDVPPWLHNLDALIVDEIQDLTLLQIAMLGELAHTRIMQNESGPFIFTIAGDESQIVQPSGFDWGVTKELLGEILGLWPEEFEFRHQRRAPRNLAQLIDNTWAFYGELPRPLRPSARREFYVDTNLVGSSSNGAGLEEIGRIQVCAFTPHQAPALPRNGPEKSARSQNRTEFDWSPLLEELADKPGRALVDLTESLHQILTNLAQGKESTVQASLARGEEVLFLPREIKGLERTTVLVYGLQETYMRAHELIHDATGSNIPKFEARRLFDEIRVALSRTTTNLILLEPSHAPVLEKLGLKKLEGYEVVTPEELLESLRLEEMSELEIIEGYLDEVDDLFERGRWEYAFRRNRRAHQMAAQLKDLALQREVEEQYIGGYVLQAASLVAAGNWQEAYTCSQAALKLALEFADPLVIARADEQHQTLTQELVQRVEHTLRQARQWAERSNFKIARQDAYSAIELAKLIEHQALMAESHMTIADVCWRWAYQLTSLGSTLGSIEHGATLLDEAARTVEPQQPILAAALKALAQRYHRVVPNPQMSEAQVRRILRYGQEFIEFSTQMAAEPALHGFVERWLEETYADLGERVQLYYDWASTAQQFSQLAPYPVLDERIWDLENRFVYWCEGKGEARLQDAALEHFRALLLANNGDYVASSALWERLGETHLAVDTAREGGDILRAYHLLQRNHLEIPPALGLAVDTLGLLDQLVESHAALRPQEQRAIAARVTELAAQMRTRENDEE